MKKRNSDIILNRLDGTGTSHLWRQIKKHWPYYLIFLPVFVHFIVFRYAPMYGVLMAFKDYKIRKGIMGSPWLDPWYKNFVRALSSPVFMRAVGNTLEMSLARLLIGFWFPIILALLIDECPFTKFKKTFQTISYLPYFISWVILSGILRIVLSPTTGALNAVLKAFGADPIYFLGEAGKFQGVIFWSAQWAGIGYSTIIYLAAMSNVDPQLVEAARLDGASRLKVVWHVTLPAIRPVIVICLILALRGIMGGSFDQVFNLYSPGVYETGDIIETYTYRVGLIDHDYSYSTAVGLFQSLVGLAVVLICNFVARRLDPHSALF